MKTLLRTLALGLLLSLPSSAHAASPSVSPISDMTVNAGATVTVNVVAVDTDGDPITLTSSVPGYGLLNSPTSGSGIVYTTLTLNPLAADAGATDTLSVTATAGAESDTETFMVTVAATGSDLAPTVTAPPTQSVTEGDLLSFIVTAADADQEAISSLVATGLPTGATFTPNGTNTSGTFDWTPTAGQAGQYDVVFTAANALSGSATTHIMVLATDLGPLSIASVDDLTIAEGGSVTVNVSVSDPDSGTINLSASGLPAFATLNPPTTSTGTSLLQTTITIAPGAGTAGTYPVTLTATSGSETDTESFTIVVTGPGQNDAPVVDAPSTRTVDEGQMLTFTVNATDADGDTVALSASNLPAGASFTDHGDNTGTFAWTPGSEQSGTYTVTFAGNDGHGGTDTDETVITVNDVSGGDFETNATLIGRYNPHRKFLCFRVRQTDADFDLRLVTLSSLTLAFEGRTIDGLAGKTHIGYECDECNECDEGDDDCDDCDDDDDCDDREDCEADHLRACFAMSALRDLFDGDVVDGLLESEIRGTLSTGETFVATLGGKHLADLPGNGNDRGEGEGGKKSLKLQVRPNPLNPKADITFTLARAGQVRIALYDLRGRLVKTILDENRTVGDHTVAWDGSSGEGGRVASGVYFLRIQAQQGEDVQRVTVLK